MFYANNELVKGIFLNGRNYNYLSYGFGKIIPEDRTAEQLNLNLAYKYLNQYRIEWGTVKDGYENALVSPRLDMPDSNGVFHSPFTYYYNNNIISTKEVNVLVNNAHWALLNAFVYNDMNINGNITYFATNTDFLGHNVNVFPEGEDEPIYKARLNQPILSNCTNFSFDIQTRFSKQDGYPSVGNCNNFSGNFKYVGNQDYKYPGFRGFLYECKDGVFNIDCTNMHGGGSDANVTNYYNFIGIQSCSNINLNIIGSSWQVWPHDHSFSRNCNINTYNVISGFGYMNYCNFNVVLPKDSKPEMDKGFEFLNNAENCNYNLNALDVNLFNYRSGVGHTAFFDSLNNCNLNLLVNNTVSFDHSFGGNFNHCNIVFDNIKADLSTSNGWSRLRNCNISGNVEAAASAQGFIERCDSLNINLNAAKSSRILSIWGSGDINGNLVCGNMTYVSLCTYLNLNVSGGVLNLINVEHSRFNLNRTRAEFISINNVYAIANNTTFRCYNTNNTNIDSDGGSTGILGADNCYNLTLSGLTFQTPDSDSLFENIYNSNLKFGIVNPYYRLWRVAKCKIDGFPRGLAYVNNCVFSPFNMRYVGLSNSIVGTWNNVWPHKATAGIRSTDSIRNCRIVASGWGSDGSVTFNNVNNMQTSFGNYYDGTVTANLPTYNMEIKINVDCNTLNLGIFQAGPPHGFQNATISANDIYAKGNMPSSYVQVGCDTKLYCENYCNVRFQIYVPNINSVLQPVVLINNYDHYNTGTQSFFGGLTRIGSMSTRTGPRNLSLFSGACVFINNAVLGNILVDNSLLFVGSNYDWTGTVNVTNGGIIASKEDWGSYGPRIVALMESKNFCWNIRDSGPWGAQSLFDYCLNV